MMKHVFYFMVLMLALYELAKALNCRKFYKRVDKYRKLDHDARTGYLKAHPVLYLAIFIEFVGWIVAIMGLLGTQWPCFAVVTALSLARFHRLGDWAVCVGGVVTMMMYLFAVLNSYIFHITSF